MSSGKTLEVGAAEAHLEDMELQNLAINTLKNHSIALRALNVAVENGVVTVTGTLDTFYRRQIAITSLRRLQRFAEIRDQIAVAEYA